jgi:hypothetical protein
MNNYKSHTFFILASIIYLFLWQINEISAQTKNSDIKMTDKITKKLADKTTHKLTENEAITLAEQFVAQNGYTDAPANKSKIAYESLERYTDIDKMLDFRKNTLKRKAYGICHKAKRQRGWTIVFEFKNPNSQTSDEKPVGRAITMDEFGDKIKMEHCDFFLSAVDKRL